MKNFLFVINYLAFDFANNASSMLTKRQQKSENKTSINKKTVKKLKSQLRALTFHASLLPLSQLETLLSGAHSP